MLSSSLAFGLLLSVQALSSSVDSLRRIIESYLIVIAKLIAPITAVIGHGQC